MSRLDQSDLKAHPARSGSLSPPEVSSRRRPTWPDVAATSSRRLPPAAETEGSLLPDPTENLGPEKPLSRRQFVARMGGGAGALALTAAEPAASQGKAEPKKEPETLKGPPGSGDDVPLHHPLYALVNYLTTELKLPTGYPKGTFGGKRTLMRIEFAVASQRLATEVQREVLALRFPPGYRSPGGPASERASYRAPLDPERPLTDPKRVRDAVAGLRFLFETLTPEIMCLGADMTKLYSELDRLRAKAAADIAADIAAEEKRSNPKP